jgi:thiol:disulfide interchange protein
VLGALLLGTGCEIRDEQVQSGSVQVNARRLLPPSNKSDGQIVNHDAPTTIEYVEGYRAGLERAAASGKPLVIICRASWCRWCAGLSQGILADPEVIQRSSRCVCVTLDADRDAETCQRLGVRGFPTVILQTPAGREVKRLTGRSEVRTLAAAIDEATARIAAAAPPTTEGTPVLR